MGYLIEDVKCGITEGGLCCGPVYGSVVVCVKFNDSDKSRYIYNIEFDGLPAFFITDEDVFDKIMEDDASSVIEKFYEQSHIEQFNGIKLSDEYDEIFDSMQNVDDIHSLSLIRYIITLTRCPNEEVENMVKLGKGHYVSEIDIPLSDVEDVRNYKEN